MYLKGIVSKYTHVPENIVMTENKFPQLVKKNMSFLLQYK